MKVIWKRSLALMVAFVVLMGLIAVFPFGRGVVAEARFCGYGDDAVTTALESEFIYYTRKEENYIETVGGAPLYQQLSEYPNSCGAVGGAMIVGFYDKYYEDLIPGYQSYTPIGTYRRTDRVYIPKLMGELYTLMRTNVDDVGVSQADCLSGLSQYIKNHGKTMTYSSIKSSNKVNEAAYINALNANKPTLLFCSKMDLLVFAYGTNVVEIGKQTFSGAHIAVAYGYFELKFYNDSGLFKTEKFLRVATGLAGSLQAYMRIDATYWYNAAYSINIY